MESFIKKIWGGDGEDAHYQFVRFSKGIFENRALLNLWKTNKIKLRGSFEWANDFVSMTSELIEKGKVSGIVLSKKDISEVISQNKIQGNSKEKKGGMYYQNNIEEQELGTEKIKELLKNSYVCLLNVNAPGVILKIKKKLPKPGKSREGKIDDKFCQLELDLKYWTKVKEVFELPESKKCKIYHTFEIEQIIMPETDEKDFAKLRELAKRKGRITRKMNIDGLDRREEKEFVA